MPNDVVNIGAGDSCIPPARRHVLMVSAQSRELEVELVVAALFADQHPLFAVAGPYIFDALDDCITLFS